MTASSTTLLLPALVLMLITLLVWVLLFIRRIAAINAQQIAPEAMQTSEKFTAMLDDRTNAPSNCLKNLFEMPVLFYAICAFISFSGAVDSIYINLAWGYVIFRAIQALIHCSYNAAMHRFYAYLASCLLLWAMVIRFFLALV